MAADRPRYPKPDIVDRTLMGLRSGFIPLGTQAAALIRLMVPTMTTRQAEWGAHIDTVVDTLLSQQVSLEELGSDPQFLTIVPKTTRVALEADRSAKLERLRAVIVNAAIRDLSRDSNQFFAQWAIRLIEELTEEHFIILKFASSPSDWYEKRALPWEFSSRIPTSRTQVMRGAELGIADEVADVAVQDLVSRHLLNELGGLMTGSGASGPFTTDQGNRVLAWIEGPRIP